MTEKIYLNRVAFGNLICYTIKIQAKDYNGVVRLFYGMITGIVVYRIVSIIAVFIINLLYRRRNAKKAAALRVGNYIP